MEDIFGIKKKGPLDLPPEVTELIFKRLEDPDLLSCMNTCSSWRSILESNRKLFLFSQVLPMVMTKLSEADCFNCRLVCKKWRNGVDNALQNHPSRLTVQGGLEFPSFPRKCVLHQHRHYGPLLNSLEVYQRFLQGVQPPTKRNPFVGRCVQLIMNNSNEYWYGCKLLLERFGKEIWYASIYIDDIENPEKDTDYVEVRLLHILLLLPNVKWLKLGVSGYESEERESQLKARVLDYFKSHPLPKLRDLETLSVYNSDADEAPSSLFMPVLKHCCDEQTLKRLDIVPLRYDPDEYQFPNLTDFAAKLQINEFARLKEVSPQLMTIKLELATNSDGESGKNFDFDEVFKGLEVFETLKELCIKNEITLNDANSDLKINLPNLRGLNLMYSGPPEKLANFHLKYLTIRNFTGGMHSGKLLADIGQLIPSLKRLMYIGRLEMIGLPGYGVVIMDREFNTDKLVQEFTREFEVEIDDNEDDGDQGPAENDPVEEEME